MQGYRIDTMIQYIYTIVVRQLKVLQGESIEKFIVFFLSKESSSRVYIYMRSIKIQASIRTAILYNKTSSNEWGFFYESTDIYK
jgi:hypothetical protein